MNRIADLWADYEIIDAGQGMKLERWGDIILARPDPQAIWNRVSNSAWDKADAVYSRSHTGGGAWSYRRKCPDRWTVSYDKLRFYVEPTGFKHTGLFPEQAANWEVMMSLIEMRCKEGAQPRILNLFGYTGGATVACASRNAHVCHVDAAKGMVARAKDNMALSGLADKSVRYIVDDAFKFVAREIKRGNKYDGIIMDPPSYGRGPNGEVWKLEDNLAHFVREAMKLLSDNPLFFLLNSYTTGFSPTVTGNILRTTACSSEMSNKRVRNGELENGDLLIPISSMKGTFLPCGSFAMLEWRS